MATVAAPDAARDKALVADLFGASRATFWADMLISAAVGWASFAFACDAKPLSLEMLVAFFIACMALYRALAFVHELSHHRPAVLPGFARVWNLLVGFPLLWPTAVYAEMHLDHHRPQLYGTKGDPECLLLAGKPLTLARVAAQPLFIPAILWLRWFVLAPLGFLIPPLHRQLEKYGAAMPMNLAYTRSLDPDQRRASLFLPGGSDGPQGADPGFHRHTGQPRHRDLGAAGPALSRRAPLLSRHSLSQPRQGLPPAHGHAGTARRNGFP